MLGKCIKNEFVNRSGLVGMISAGVMLFAVIVLGLDKLYNVVGTTAFAVFVKLVDVMFALAMFAVISGIASSRIRGISPIPCR